MVLFVCFFPFYSMCGVMLNVCLCYVLRSFHNKSMMETFCILSSDTSLKQDLFFFKVSEISHTQAALLPYRCTVKTLEFIIFM